jgi:hypothetical protein
MKTFSATDIILFPELSHLRMLDVIDPKHTDLISPFLKLVGFDLDYPVQFVPSQHRNLQGQVVIAYMLVGDVECNESFLNSAWATTEDRIIAAGYKDLGKAQDMAQALTSARDYDNGITEGFPPDLVNPDESEITMQIKVLADLLLLVRGSPFKQDGSRFTLAEHGIAEAPEKRRKKPVKVAQA